jgi:hypothetical protein
MDDPAREPPHAGLCASCVHAAIIRSSRGAVFYMCQLSKTDPRFARYPRLPVIDCAGYARNPRLKAGL